MNRLKAIIFDFDGVILDSVHIKTDAFLELFEAYPEHHDAIRAYHLEHGGISRFVKFKWIHSELLKDPINEKQALELGERFSQLVFSKILSAPFIPGAREFLSYSGELYHCFVASGTPQDELRQIVDQRGLRDFFKEVKGTPASKEEIVTELLHKYSLYPTECLFIGDAMTDYHAATNTGTHFIARTNDELVAHWQSLEVTAVKNLMEIVHVIDGQYKKV